MKLGSLLKTRYLLYYKISDDSQPQLHPVRVNKKSKLKLTRFNLDIINNHVIHRKW